jgi:chromosomal replication initiation ATPase DnaA
VMKKAEEARISLPDDAAFFLAQKNTFQCA